MPVLISMPEPLKAPNPPLQPPNNEESQEEGGLPEEDVHSVVGISISRAQTRLVSPQTPKAEKTAALSYPWGSDGLYDGIEDGRRYEESGHISRSSLHGSSNHAPDPALNTEPCEIKPDVRFSPEANLPTPWRATPAVFEGEPNCPRSRASTGPTTMLESLNLKRFMLSIHSMSLSKSASLKDLSLSSISSLFGGSKDNSPPRRQMDTRRRATTVESPSANYIDMGLKSETAGIRSGSGSNDLTDGSASLRRAASDQSLALRPIVSPGSTLGDDSRWEHVQGQVNSRFKAIVDSFQDSSIKLPSLPSMPNISLNSLRPDFTRNRSGSDTKVPSRNQHEECHDSESPENRGATKKPKITPMQSDKFIDGAKGVQKSSKSVLSQLDQALEQLTGDLVILGGYRGSILRSAKPPHRQLWVPVKIGLNIRKVDLEVGLHPEDEENMENTIFASGMLTHIGPVDMGRRLMKRLRGCANAQQGKLRVHDYGYDWRLSPHLLSRRLVEFLQKLPSNAEDTPRAQRGATIIAHSLGGLITRHAVNQRPELFAGVLYAGVPQHCVNILGPLRNGDDVLLSSKVLTAQVNFTLRTSFLLLPETGKCFIDKKTKEEYPVNFFNVDDWREHGFSPCIASTLPAASATEKKGILGSVSASLPSISLPIKLPSLISNQTKEKPMPLPESAHTAANTAKTSIDHPGNPATKYLDPHLDSPPASTSISANCTIPLPAALSYLTKTLASTLTFKHELSFRPLHASQNHYPPLSILYSTSIPTVAAARVTSREAIRRADAYDDLAFGSGDGVCLAKAAMLPEGYECAEGGRVRTERGHVGLLGDLEAVGRCLLAIGEARRRGAGLGCEHRDEGQVGGGKGGSGSGGAEGG